MSSFSQDTIVKVNDMKVICHITKRSLEKVYYKPYKSLNSAEYFLKMEDVKYINSEPITHFVEVFEEPIDSSLMGRTLEARQKGIGMAIYTNERRLTHLEIISLFARHSKCNDLYLSGKTLKAFGGVFIYPSVVIALSGVFLSVSGEEINMSMMAISGAGVILGFFMSSSGNAKIRKSIDLYNSEISSASQVQLDFGIQANGIGLALKF